MKPIRQPGEAKHDQNISTVRPANANYKLHALRQFSAWPQTFGTCFHLVKRVHCLPSHTYLTAVLIGQSLA